MPYYFRFFYCVLIGLLFSKCIFGQKVYKHFNEVSKEDSIAIFSFLELKQPKNWNIQKGFLYGLGSNQNLELARFKDIRIAPAWDTIQFSVLNTMIEPGYCNPASCYAGFALGLPDSVSGIEKGIAFVYVNDGGMVALDLSDEKHFLVKKANEYDFKPRNENEIFQFRILATRKGPWAKIKASAISIMDKRKVDEIYLDSIPSVYVKGKVGLVYKSTSISRNPNFSFRNFEGRVK